MGGAEGVWGAGGRGGGVHGWGGEARKLEGLGIVNHWVEMRSGGQGCLWELKGGRAPECSHQPRTLGESATLPGAVSPSVRLW